MGWQWHQLHHMQIICILLHADNHGNTSSLNFYRPDAFADAQPTVSKHWRQSNKKTQKYGHQARNITNSAALFLHPSTHEERGHTPFTPAVQYQYSENIQMQRTQTQQGNRGQHTLPVCNLKMPSDSLSQLHMQNMPHYVKTRRHPQNRKYITYCTAVRGGPSHGYR